MRALMTAGPALARDHLAGYNCSYLPIIDQRCFDEAMFILMNGTGVGYSVERQYINQLPVVAEQFHTTETCIKVADSKQGWAGAFRQLISLLYAGQIPTWNLENLRAKGSRLKTFGGRSSGPGPLDELFHFTVALFKRAYGRKLTSVECSDLVCKTAEVVVVGGVRRSALICLSNLTDERMQGYKSGHWWLDSGHRALANISTAYTEKPEFSSFIKEWTSLYDSKSGERGIFNRVSAEKQSAAGGRRKLNQDWGTNPCGEIILRPFGLCNLSEVVVRNGDTFEQLSRKVETAAIIGTFQSTLTDFKYIRKAWQNNADEERLLGVSLTGIMDHLVLSGDSVLQGWLDEFKTVAIKTNQEYADRLGIPHSVAITTVKPSGTVSQLVDSSSGIHPRHSAYYIRTVRADVKDPLAIFMKEKGIPCEPDVTNPNNLVFSFPSASPMGCITRKDISALDALSHYLIYKQHWCEHNPSITVTVKEHEWFDVGAWVFRNMSEIGGISFLPDSDHVYRQAPYQDITEETYTKLAATMPILDWDEFAAYELTDTTTGMQDLACVSGYCEVT
jgi:ribonucleoside-diphosphate reductase alpha chain